MVPRKRSGLLTSAMRAALCVSAILAAEASVQFVYSGPVPDAQAEGVTRQVDAKIGVQAERAARRLAPAAGLGVGGDDGRRGVRVVLASPYAR